jgi:hypothetical protein
VIKAAKPLLQLRVLGLGLLQDGDFGVGVFPDMRKARMDFATAAVPPGAASLGSAGRSEGCQC